MRKLLEIARFINEKKCLFAKKGIFGIRWIIIEKGISRGFWNRANSLAKKKKKKIQRDINNK